MKTNWKHASDIPRRHWNGFMARVTVNDLPCEHGHSGCSDRREGPCSDELQQMIEVNETASNILMEMMES